MTRLFSLAPDLAIKLREASPEQRRRALQVACEYSVRVSGVDHPAVHQALKCISSGSDCDKEIRQQLIALCEQIDARYFTTQLSDAHADESVKLFGQARAVAALSAALGETSGNSIEEAVYEAAASTGDQKEFLDLVRAELVWCKNSAGG